MPNRITLRMPIIVPGSEGIYTPRVNLYSTAGALINTFTGPNIDVRSIFTLLPIQEVHDATNHIIQALQFAEDTNTWGWPEDHLQACMEGGITILGIVEAGYTGLEGYYTVEVAWYPADRGDSYGWRLFMCAVPESQYNMFLEMLRCEGIPDAYPGWEHKPNPERMFHDCVQSRMHYNAYWEDYWKNLPAYIGAYGDKWSGRSDPVAAVTGHSILMGRPHIITPFTNATWTCPICGEVITIDPIDPIELYMSHYGHLYYNYLGNWAWEFYYCKCGPRCGSPAIGIRYGHLREHFPEDYDRPEDVPPELQAIMETFPALIDDLHQRLLDWYISVSGPPPGKSVVLLVADYRNNREFGGHAYKGFSYYMCWKIGEINW